MHFDQREYDKNPLSRTEVTIILVFCGLFLFMMTMEIVSNFQPRKLSVLLFVLFWIPLLFLHEFGHAMMAKALGWRVSKIHIGFGKRLFSSRFMGAPLDVRVVPFEGFVQCAPRDLHFVRMKNALIYFAGPGIELLLFLIILGLFGSEWMFTVTDHYGDIALQSLAFAALASAVINLIPVGIITKDGSTPNDGLGILLALVQKKQDYRDWLEQEKKDPER